MPTGAARSRRYFERRRDEITEMKSPVNAAGRGQASRPAQPFSRARDRKLSRKSETVWDSKRLARAAPDCERPRARDSAAAKPSQQRDGLHRQRAASSRCTTAAGDRARPAQTRCRRTRRFGASLQRPLFLANAWARYQGPCKKSGTPRGDCERATGERLTAGLSTRPVAAAVRRAVVAKPSGPGRRGKRVARTKWSQRVCFRLRSRTRVAMPG
jgi:hypothetical protein